MAALTVKPVALDHDVVRTLDGKTQGTTADDCRSARGGLERDRALEGATFETETRPTDRDVPGHRVTAPHGQGPGWPDRGGRKERIGCVPPAERHDAARAHRRGRW